MGPIHLNVKYNFAFHIADDTTLHKGEALYIPGPSKTETQRYQ